MKASKVWIMVLALLSAPPLLAQGPQAVQGEEGVSYVSGGVGQEEREALTASARNYNLKLVFASQEFGSYMSDLKVSIQGAKGKELVNAVSDGPWFYAKLPPGAYQVTASTGDQKQARKVTVGKGRLTQVTFRFR